MRLLRYCHHNNGCGYLSLAAYIAILFVAQQTTLVEAATASLQNLAPNQAINLGPYPCTGPEPFPKCQNITDFSSMVYDAKRQQIVMFGGGHAATFTDTVARLDLNSLSWSELYPHTPCAAMDKANHDVVNGAWLAGGAGPYPRPTSRHSYDMLAIVNDELVLLAGEQPSNGTCAPQGLITKLSHTAIAHYDLNNNSWQFTQTPTFKFFPGTAVDPVTQEIVLISQREIAVYNPRTRTKRQLASVSLAAGIENSLVYYPPLDAFYYFARRGKEVHSKVFKAQPIRSADDTHIIDIIIEPVATTGQASPNRRGYAYDSQQHLIGGGIADNRFYVFDPMSNHWQSRYILGGSPIETAHHALVFDPVNNIYIFIAKHHDTWAFRYSSEQQAGLDTNKASSATATTALGGTVRVGPGQQFSRPSDIAKLVADGTVIEIVAGVYQDDVAVWRANDLTLRGVGGKAHLQMTGRIGLQSGNDQKNGKAIWVIAGNNVTVENIEFSGAKVSDRNGAGIRAEGADLIVRDCYFHHNENGILGGQGSIVIEHSEFAYNGYGDGRSHNVYISKPIKELIFRFNYSHHANIGHNLKTRAAVNYILYNRLIDEAEGRSSYALDIPNGGLSYVMGNVLQQNQDTDNWVLLRYGAERDRNPQQQLYAINNTLVNDRNGGRFISISDDTSAYIINNAYLGSGDFLEGGNEDDVLSHNLKLEDNEIVARGAYDYQLRSNSRAINGGTIPRSDDGDTLIPTLQYVHPLAKKQRSDDGSLDVGAFEFQP